MNEAGMHAGGCLCGAVRFEARGAALRVVACHCTMCRMHTGAPFVLLAVYPPDAVTVSGATLDYRSSAKVVRRRCAACGAQFLIVGERHDVLEIYTGCFDDPEPFVPEYEIFTANRPGWLPSLGDIPRYRRFRDDG